MRQNFFVAISFTCLLILTSSGISNNFSIEIDSYVLKRNTPTKFSGDVLVAREGKVIFHKSYGMADYENDIPNSTDTIFRIGSLTKPITAVAVLILQDQSRLDLGDSIRRFIPKISEDWKKVKIMHLLSHSSGIPDLFGDLQAVPVEDTANEIDRVIATTNDRTLQFEAGTKYEYSNFNYCLLGYIIEKASVQTYASFMKKNIFDPSGMNHTFYDDPRPIIKKRAEGYVAKRGQLMNDKLADPAGYAAGGLLSTAEDLFRFDQALHSGKLISAQALSKMFTPASDNYGYGWQITKQFNRSALCHRGGTHGFSSYFVRYPDDRMFIAVLSNVEEQSTRAVACDIASLIFNHALLAVPEPPHTHAESLRSYIGDFRLTTGEIRTIEMESGALYYKSGNAKYKLLPLSSDEFVLEDAEEIRLKFVKAVDGSIEMVRSSCGQEEMRGKKADSKD
ncbi:beta-lactamase family protein [bacterium]|nr:beta-lactamase family protein [bacterium]